MWDSVVLHRTLNSLRVMVCVQWLVPVNVIICFPRWFPGAAHLPPKAPGMDSITECSVGDKSLPTRPHQEHTTEFLSH